ncbi:RNA-binding protein 7 [Plodia interpunctella]|uniref:RNA-binding protein 7 n=1 Tax=Plodia interpunctella TaxID=58824 RepID=UPI0023683705|nr:RNA-binding protein 7 [Plodia interpunctella]
MIEDDNKTLWCGNLPEQATEELLYELFLQAGPLEKVRIAKDRDGRQKNFAFITYSHEVSVPYALNLFRGTALFHRKLSLQSRGRLAWLPPPIRCTGPELNLEFSGLANVAQQFVDMTERLQEEEYRAIHGIRQPHDYNDKLVVASLQGNWSHRHHPYMPNKDKLNHNPHNRDEFRQRENISDRGNQRNKHANSWRDRRNHRKGNYQRRD